MREAVLGLLGFVSGLLAASCCIAPTLFVIGGVSISWLGSVGSTLELYRPIFLGIGYASVAYAVYKLFLKRRFFTKGTVECACEEPRLFNKVAKVLTIASLILLIIATFYPHIVARVYS